MNDVKKDSAVRQGSQRDPGAFTFEQIHTILGIR
jgi:hypothetical protein